MNVENSYYHIYSRGNNKQSIFIDHDDYIFFLSILKRYLSHDEAHNSKGLAYLKLYDELELLAYCQMPNHFHLLIYQIKAGGMTRLMRHVVTTYSQYFNNKYKRTGSVFESRFKASRITTDQYLLHISRYIHLNPVEWNTYTYSSLSAYKGLVSYDWLITDRILNLYGSTTRYLGFVKHYKPTHDELDTLKHLLANQGDKPHRVIDNEQTPEDGPLGFVL